MNKKNLIILCIIFAILIGLVFVKRNIKPQIPTTEEAADIIVPLLSIDSLSEIVVRLGDGNSEDADKPKNVHLVKKDDQWIVETQYGVYANEKTITPLLEKLDRLEGELRSDKKGLLNDYGIDDNEGVHVELRRKGAEGTHIVVGTQKIGYQGNFVRLSGTNAVYVVNENLLGALGVRGEGEDQKLDANKWADKHIIHLDVDNVVGFAITRTADGTEETIMDIRKRSVDGKKQWQSVTPYAFGLSASKIQNVLETFNNTYAREIIAPDVPKVFDAPDWTGVFTSENGDEVKLVRGAKDADEKNYYAKQEGAGYFYLIPVSTFDSREKQQGNVFASNPLKVEEGNVDEIKVVDIDSKGEFHALKKASSEPSETSTEENTGNQEAKDKVVWQTLDGEDVEAKKVRDVISKIKNLNLEIISRAISLPKVALTINVTKEGELKEYTISKDTKLDNGKECHFLKLKGEAQNYCVSKPHVSALQKALP